MGNLRRKCEVLTASQADRLFFPGKGGKSNKAKLFCGDCPFQGQCLREAIELDLEGFYSGTTKAERDEMAKFLNLVINPLTPEIIESKRKRVYRKIVISEDPHAWLDKVSGPTEQELNRLSSISA